MVSQMGILPASLRPSSRVRVAQAQEESYQPSTAGDGVSEVGDHAKPRRDIDSVSLSESVDQRAAEDDVPQRRMENESHIRADPPTHASDVFRQRSDHCTRRPSLDNLRGTIAKKLGLRNNREPHDPVDFEPFNVDVRSLRAEAAKPTPARRRRFTERFRRPKAAPRRGHAPAHANQKRVPSEVTTPTGKKSQGTKLGSEL